MSYCMAQGEITLASIYQRQIDAGMETKTAHGQTSTSTEAHLDTVKTFTQTVIFQIEQLEACVQVLDERA